MKNLNLWPCVRPGVSCDYHRIQLPLETAGVPTEGVGPEVTAGHLVLFNRLPTMPSAQFLQEHRRIGFRYIVDIDDYWFLYPGHYLRKHWERQNYAQQIVRIMKNATAVTVSTSFLADHVLEYNKNVHVLPNALPFDDGQFTVDCSGIKEGSMVYVGGASHRHDLITIYEALNNCRSVSFTIAGVDDHHVAEWNAIKSMFSGVCNFKSAKPVNKYMELYNGHGFAIAPLLRNEFNWCKSNLKVLEAGAKGIPIICEGSMPYLNDVDKKIVTYAHDVSDWVRQIELFSSSAGLREERGLALAAHVRKHYDLEDINKIRFQIYEHYGR